MCVCVWPLRQWGMCTREGFREEASFSKIQVEEVCSRGGRSMGLVEPSAGGPTLRGGVRTGDPSPTPQQQQLSSPAFLR